MNRARVYAVALGVLSIAVLLLLGCERNSVSEETLVERPKATPTADIEGVVVREPGDMLSLSISYSDMSRISAYDYTLKENGGEVLFSCFFFTDDYEEVSFEDMPVDSKYMDELRSLVEQHGFADMDYKEPGPRELAADAPTYSLIMRFPKTIGGRVYSDAHRLNYHPAGTEDLLKVFLELREIFANDYNAS
jgi:hypothetical protein